MNEGPAGVRGPMPTGPDTADRRPWLAGLLALGAAAILLAGVPSFVSAQVFTTGFALRAVVFALVTAGALFAAWAGPGTRPALGRLHAIWLALPLGVALLGLPAFDHTWAGAARGSYTWLLLGLWPLALLWTWRRNGEPEHMLRVLVVAGAFAAFWALLPVVSGGVAIGPFGRTGVAGPVFGALIAPALLFPPTRHKLLRWLPLVLIAAACLATRSRTGVAAAVIGTTLALSLGLQTEAARRRMRMATAAVAALFAVALGLLADGVSVAPGTNRTIEVRLGLHRASLSAIADRPVRGHGLGSYPTQAIQHRDLAEARLEQRRRPFHAHMDYLHASVEGGVPAGVLLLVFVGGLGVLAMRGDGPRRQRAAAAGIIATLGIAALGDGVLIDPAPALLLATAAAIALRRATARERPTGVLPQIPLVLGAFVALGLGYVLAKDALADRELMRYRAAIQHDITARDAELAARRHLQAGALTWRADHPEALYRLGVHQASQAAYEAARATYRRALRADPGMTEARLDLAQVYQLEGRYDDARSVLAEAERRDPTRYDIPRRIMELVLGPEPVPGDAPVPLDEIEVLRWLNKARNLAPDRFENELDEARFQRRRATSASGLAGAGALVRAALAKAPGDPRRPPAEVLIESFRLAEAENRSSDLVNSTILMDALRTNPRPSRRFRVEAERFLDEGKRREYAALEAVNHQRANADFTSADRAYGAAAVRFTALLYADRVNPVEVLALAKSDKDRSLWRAALARYRALLAWTLPPHAGNQVSALAPTERLAALAKQGDLLLEAAGVAYHVDRLLASFYRTRGQLRIGTELLEKGQPKIAETKLRAALKTDPNLAEAHFGLSRVLARLGQEAEAEAALLEALRLKPALKGPALAEPDLAGIRKRTGVRTRLGLP